MGSVGLAMKMKCALEHEVISGFLPEFSNIIVSSCDPARIEIEFDKEETAKNFLEQVGKSEEYIASCQQGNTITLDEKGVNDFLTSLMGLKEKQLKGSGIYVCTYGSEKQKYFMAIFNALVQSIDPSLKFIGEAIGARIFDSKHTAINMSSHEDFLKGAPKSQSGLPHITKDVLEECRQVNYYTTIPEEQLIDIQDNILKRAPEDKQRRIDCENDERLHRSSIHNVEGLHIFQALARTAKVQTNYFLYKDPSRPLLSGLVGSFGKHNRFTEIVVSGPRPYPEAASAWYLPGDPQGTLNLIKTNLNLFEDIGNLIFSSCQRQAGQASSAIFVNRYSLGSHLLHIKSNMKQAYRCIGKPFKLIDPITLNEIAIDSGKKLEKFFIDSITQGLVLAMMDHGDNVDVVFTDFFDNETGTKGVIEQVKHAVHKKSGRFAGCTPDEQKRLLANIAKLEDTGTKDLLTLAAKYKSLHPDTHVATVLSASAGTAAGISKGQYFTGAGYIDNRSEEAGALISLGGLITLQVEKRQAICTIEPAMTNNSDYVNQKIHSGELNKAIALKEVTELPGVLCVGSHVPYIRKSGEHASMVGNVKLSFESDATAKAFSNFVANHFDIAGETVYSEPASGHSISKHWIIFNDNDVEKFLSGIDRLNNMNEAVRHVITMPLQKRKKAFENFLKQLDDVDCNNVPKITSDEKEWLLLAHKGLIDKPLSSHGLLEKTPTKKSGLLTQLQNIEVQGRAMPRVGM